MYQVLRSCGVKRYLQPRGQKVQRIKTPRAENMSLPTPLIFMERWPSGRRQRFRKPSYGNVPWVRIPLSPPKNRIGRKHETIRHSSFDIRRHAMYNRNAPCMHRAKVPSYLSVSSRSEALQTMAAVSLRKALRQEPEVVKRRQRPRGRRGRSGFESRRGSI